MMSNYKRRILQDVLARSREPRKFIQVFAGPRQTGKTTLAKQLMESVSFPSHYASADEQAQKGASWIEQNWETARLKIENRREKRLLILDEIQKIYNWPETIKRLWDEDTLSGINLILVLLGSSPLLVQKGLTESLAGRFEITQVTHWSFHEMKEAFGWDADRYIYYGGYPGSSILSKDHKRWVDYIRDSLIETSITRDILLMTRVDKPALLRQLFELGCAYSGQIFSYQKMLGQLQDAGNTTTLAHYLSLLQTAGLLAGIPKFSMKTARQRSSSPKFQVMNTALMSAQSYRTLAQAKGEPNYWGRLAESAIGAHLVNGSREGKYNVYYWNEGNCEVDFVLVKDKKTVLVEVKSGKKKESIPGVEKFSNKFSVYKKLLIGKQGISFDQFLLTDPQQWFL